VLGEWQNTAVRDATGKLVTESIIETKATTIRERDVAFALPASGSLKPRSGPD
jgi:hypothetical protein